MMSSQLSEADTIPYELSQDQDPIFINDLAYVNELYFQVDNPDQNPSHSDSLFSGVDSDSDDNVESDIDTDCDSDDIANECTAQYIYIEHTSHDTHELSKHIDFFKEKCGCNNKCTDNVVLQEAIDFRGYCQELSKEELDLVIKTQLFSCRRNGSDNKKTYQRYYFKGQPICRALFCFLHDVGKQKLQTIGRSLDKDGLMPRIHGNTNRQPVNSLKFDDRQSIVKFISKYASDNAVSLPGRLPNFKHMQVLLLPSDKRQSDIHDLYEESAQLSGLRSVSLTTFSRLWKELCPNIVLSRPQTDLCHKCQMYTSEIASSGCMEEEQKTSLLDNYQTHLRLAKNERDLYRRQCLDSKDLFKHVSPVTGSAPGTFDGQMHYSWDYAQQVHYPHHSHQVGSIFFKTPRKCQVFGVTSEGSGQQVFYLSDEGDAPGKGSNTVISQVHHYLETYGYGEKHALFHCDNCSGQNKNNAVISYALWRVQEGLHTSIQISFMVAGHTKFAPDWHFGIWKSKWRNSDVETLAGVAATVTASSRSGHNVPHLVGDVENPVVFRDWKQFSSLFKPIKNLTKYHHFSVEAAEPGIVTCREYIDSPAVKVNVLKPNKQIAQPEIIHSKGIDLDRQWYLYNEIRPFCRDNASKDTTCPRPSLCKDVSTKSKKRKLSV